MAMGSALLIPTASGVGEMQPSPSAHVSATLASSVVYSSSGASVGEGPGLETILTKGVEGSQSTNRLLWGPLFDSPRHPAEATHRDGACATLYVAHDHDSLAVL